MALTNLAAKILLFFETAKLFDSRNRMQVDKWAKRENIGYI